MLAGHVTDEPPCRAVAACCQSRLLVPPLKHAAHASQASVEHVKSDFDCPCADSLVALINLDLELILAARRPAKSTLVYCCDVKLTATTTIFYLKMHA